MQRYFAKDNNLNLLDSDIHHIKKVMRMNIGDNIEIVSNKKVYLCKINDIDNFNISITKEIEEDNELNVEIIVAVGLVTEQKFDLILQKLTELGVSKIIPLKMERSVVKVDSKKELKKLERWNLICKEAAEQSHRNIVPVVSEVTSIKELIKEDAEIKLVCSVKESNNLLNNYLQNKTNYAKILFVIGPEGGITDKEEKYLNDCNFTSISLGKRVLRVETACFYVASIINYVSMR